MRNFIHNISDVLLAAFIVVIAAGVIFWRINIIMKYPEMMSGAAGTQVEESADGAEDADGAKSADGAEDAGGAKSDDGAKKADGAKGADSADSSSGSNLDANDNSSDN